MTNLTERASQCRDFLQRSGWGEADLRPLAGDASARRYLRVNLSGKKAVLMDAPPGSGEDTRPFSQMTGWLLEVGLSAPRIFAEDAAMGFLLLEDLGDDLFARHLAKVPADEAELYTAAVRLLIRLSDVPPPDFLAPYDGIQLKREVSLFSEWWLPHAVRNASASVMGEYHSLVEETIPAVEHTREIAVLRDYHAENLIWLPERPDHACVGLLDYQDALSGHPAYDLMSLLEDARRDTSKELRASMIDLYLREKTSVDPELFFRDYSFLGVQRNLKIVGIFARLALRDGKARYLDLIPRVWEHVLRDLEHPELEKLRNWILAHAPPPTEETIARVRASASSA